MKVDIESVTGAVDVETLGKSLPELLNRYGNITECQMLGPQRRELLCVITGFRDKIHSSLIGNSAEYYSFEVRLTRTLALQLHLLIVPQVERPGFDVF